MCQLNKYNFQSRFFMIVFLFDSVLGMLYWDIMPALKDELATASCPTFVPVGSQPDLVYINI